MTWIPRSIRDMPSAQIQWEGPFSGVPDWLAPHLDGWVWSVFFQGTAGGREHYWTHGLEQIQLDLHLTLDWTNQGRSASQSLISHRISDGDTYLDIVDWCIAHTENPELPGILQRYLDSSASLYTITRLEGRRPALTERVIDTVAEAVHTAAPPNSRAAEYLALAWSNIYGRVKDPSSGYRDAIRAVEAAAKPVVSPTNTLTTLGTIISDISAKPEKWKFSLTPESGADPFEALLGQMRLIWKGQLDRHGTDDDAVPVSVSIAEAEVALHIAALLVHLFTSGAVSRV